VLEEATRIQLRTRDRIHIDALDVCRLYPALVDTRDGKADLYLVSQPPRADSFGCARPIHERRQGGTLLTACGYADEQRSGDQDSAEDRRTANPMDPGAGRSDHRM
jgi:hypothetical protein